MRSSSSAREICTQLLNTSRAPHATNDNLYPSLYIAAVTTRVKRSSPLNQARTRGSYNVR